MIQGLKIQISTAELRTHLLDRTEFHKQKLAFYKKQAKEFEQAQEKLDESFRNTSNSPMSQMEQKISDHLARATFFSFLEEHLVPNETYELSEGDLAKMEMISRYF